MKQIVLMVATLLIPACGKGAGGLEGSWKGRCKRDDNTAVTDAECMVTVGAKTEEGYPIHIVAASGELDCETLGLLDGKLLRVSAPRACVSSLGSAMAQYSLEPSDGGVALRGGFGDRGGKIVRFEGALARNTEAAKPARAASPAAAPAAPPSPPPAPPPRP